ncbi:phthalate transporter [Coccidioides immitis RS]|uniref:Phthalate transporter n=2 Tax=Coccidioides immitis TaxID=5501 RepID=A0A0D8JVK4_COCIM|nr:phthalate transporter [Coccidioides immitis RS]KJF61342.1 phthalate transporter [Coccidioides immitis RS]KMP08796.1 major facilitator superfamily protein transporter [Coccidioides immitis RMSCC 2394]TPX20662.1 hypothetical protein DIZ76_016556 [Coccidioides immitis]
MASQTTSAEGKQSPIHIEDGSKLDSESNEAFTPKEAASLRRRIDLRLIPALGFMYGISLMDRKNVSNAAIAGMRTDLSLLEGYRYSLITLCFFITYVVFQSPMTVICRKVGPRIFLPGICFLWGALVIGLGFAKNWTTVVGLRLVLGILEAGYFPGCVYLLSTWYTRFEVARRYSVFYLIGSLASALSGILAYGLMQMEGVQGVRGWRWIFIMEGVITCAIAIFAYAFIVRFPDQERDKPSFRFLQPHECQYIIDRLEEDRRDVVAEKFTLKRFLKPAGDFEIWVFAFMFFCLTTVTYAFAFFLPIILRDNLGFSLAASQCLIAPPYVFSAILMFVTSWISDRYRMRAPIILLNCIILIVGLPIMGFHSNNAVRYFGVFIAVAGANANVPAIMAYQANNIRGQWKRAFCSATLTGFGGIGGISGSLVFRSQDRPDYMPGMVACIVCAVAIMICATLLTLYFRATNKKADRGEKIIGEDPDFRYTL